MSDVPPAIDAICRLLSEDWKVEPHPWQREVIGKLLDGQDVIVIAGTGSGKSLCFQSLALKESDGLVVVISPLKGLMHDQVPLFYGRSWANLVPQVKSLTAKRVSSIALTSEAFEANPKLWNTVENGSHRIVYATPEMLLRETSYFWKNILKNPESKFLKRLVAVAVDEGHLVKDWKDFRPEYKQIGALRMCLSDVPFVVLSATMTRSTISYVIEAVRLRQPYTCRQTIRRTNLTLFTAAMSNRGFEDLHFLTVPHENKIPTTLVFLDDVNDTFRLAWDLRDHLPPELRSRSREIIRVYNSYVDDEARELYMEDLRSGTARIMICTEACGLGLDVRNIERVIQYNLMAGTNIERFTQRMGRGGRDPSIKAVGLTFVPNSALASGNKEQKRTRGKYNQNGAGEAENRRAEDGTEEQEASEEQDAEEKPSKKRQKMKVSRGRRRFARPKSGITKKRTTSDPPDNQPKQNSNINKMIFAVDPNNLETAFKFVKDMTHDNERCDPQLYLTLNTHGCRHQALLTIFDDPNIQAEHNDCCDCCIVQKQLQDGTIANPFTIHGVPLTMTVAYQNYMRSTGVSTDKDKKPSRPPLRPIVSAECKANLSTALRCWRNETWDKISTETQYRPYLNARYFLREDMIGAILEDIRKISSVEDLQTTLETCGYRCPEGLLTGHLPALFNAIEKCLEDEPVVVAPKISQSKSYRYDATFVRFPEADSINANPLPVRFEDIDHANIRRLIELDAPLIASPNRQQSLPISIDCSEANITTAPLSDNLSKCSTEPLRDITNVSRSARSGREIKKPSRFKDCTE